MFFKKESVFKQLQKAKNDREIQKILGKVPDKFYKNKNGTLDNNFVFGLMHYSRGYAPDVVDNALKVDKNASENIEFMKGVVKQRPDLFRLASESLRGNIDFIETAVSSEISQMRKNADQALLNTGYGVFNKKSEVTPYIFDNWGFFDAERGQLKDLWNEIAVYNPGYVIRNSLLGNDRESITELAKNTNNIWELYESFKERLVEKNNFRIEHNLPGVRQDPIKGYKGELSVLDDVILDRFLSDPTIKSEGVCSNLRESSGMRQIFVESIALNPDNYKKLPAEFFEGKNADILEEIDKAVANSVTNMMAQSSKTETTMDGVNIDAREVIAGASEEAKAEARRVTGDIKTYKETMQGEIQAKAKAEASKSNAAKA